MSPIAYAYLDVVKAGLQSCLHADDDGNRAPDCDDCPYKETENCHDALLTNAMNILAEIEKEDGEGTARKDPDREHTEKVKKFLDWDTADICRVRTELERCYDADEYGRRTHTCKDCHYRGREHCEKELLRDTDHILSDVDELLYTLDDEVKKRPRQEGEWLQEDNKVGGAVYACSCCGELHKFFNGGPAENNASYCSTCGAYLPYVRIPIKLERRP